MYQGNTVALCQSGFNFAFEKLSKPAGIMGIIHHGDKLEIRSRTRDKYIINKNISDKNSA